MILGAFGSCRGIAEVSTWREPVEVNLPKLPILQEEGADWEKLETAWTELQRAQTEAYRERRPASNALAVVNLISSLVLMSGAMAAGARSARGLSALRAGLSLSQAYVILGLAVGTWLQLGLVQPAQEILTPLRLLGGAAGQAAMVSLAAHWVGIPIAALGMLAQLGFYLWMQRYLRRPEILSHLEQNG